MATPRSGSAGRRPLFNALVLATGFIAGGLLNVAARQFLPAGGAKAFLTTGVTPTLGPIEINLVILRFALGPIAMDVSLLSLVGVLIAWLIARSLF